MDYNASQAYNANLTYAGAVPIVLAASRVRRAAGAAGRPVAVQAMRRRSAQSIRRRS